MEVGLAVVRDGHVGGVGVAAALEADLEVEERVVAVGRAEVVRRRPGSLGNGRELVAASIGGNGNGDLDDREDADKDQVLKRRGHNVSNGADAMRNAHARRTTIMVRRDSRMAPRKPTNETRIKMMPMTMIPTAMWSELIKPDMPWS